MPRSRCYAAFPGTQRRLSNADSPGPEFVRDGVLAAVAEMLRAGVTCFGDRYDFPDETARVACEQGMRAVIGLPVAETPGPWAQSSAECLTWASACATNTRATA